MLVETPLVASCSEARRQPHGLRCEYNADPLAIDVARPRLSWAYDAGGWRQSAYRILVASTKELLAKNQAVKWLYNHLAGLQAAPERPGFERAIVLPQPVGDVTWCRYALRTIRGRFEVHWRREHGEFSLKVTIPPNCTATVYLPDGSAREATSGQHAYRCRLR